MRQFLGKVGDLTASHKPDEGIGSDYDLAKDFILDDTEWAVYAHNHERAKEAREALSNIAAGLALLLEMKPGE